MTLVLSGERPDAAAVFNPFRTLAAWFGKARARRIQRVALADLLALDADQLDDLGINRGDLFDAMHGTNRPTRLLTARRAGGRR